MVDVDHVVRLLGGSVSKRSYKATPHTPISNLKTLTRGEEDSVRPYRFQPKC